MQRAVATTIATTTSHAKSIDVPLAAPIPAVVVGTVEDKVACVD